jgi:hypothetical protein
MTRGGYRENAGRKDHVDAIRRLDEIQRVWEITIPFVSYNSY